MYWIKSLDAVCVILFYRYVCFLYAIDICSVNSPTGLFILFVWLWRRVCCRCRVLTGDLFSDNGYLECVTSPGGVNWRCVFVNAVTATTDNVLWLGGLAAILRVATPGSKITKFILILWHQCGIHKPYFTLTSPAFHFHVSSFLTPSNQCVITELNQ